MDRSLYLVSVAQKNTRPHWAVWIPLHSDRPTGVGKKIHAVGAPQFGFKVEVEHAFDYTSSAGTITLFPLGTTDSSNVVDMVEPNKTNELNKEDKFEKVASKLDAPRASSRDVMPKGTVSEVSAALQHDIPGMRRCQEWTMEYIEALIKAKLLPGEAMDAISEARKLNPFPPTT